MNPKFRWYASALSRSCEIEWDPGTATRECDEIRLACTTDHVGMDAQFTGQLFATVSYVDAVTLTNKTITPQVRVAYGEQTSSSMFSFHAFVRFDTPIRIKPSNLISLWVYALPNASNGTSTVTLLTRWFRAAYYLRGNEDPSRHGGS